MVTVAGARITPKTLRYSFDSQIPLSMQRAIKLFAVLESKPEMILQFLHGLRGSVHATWEEEACATWLYEMVKPNCTEALM